MRGPRGAGFWVLVGALLLAGLVLGLAGAFVQAQRGIVGLPWGLTPIPWGVPVVWIALVSGVRGGAWLVRSRWGAWAVAVGWLTATVLLSAETASGDVALSGGGRQLVYLLGGVILGSAAASLPLPQGAQPSPAGRNATVS